MQKIKTSITVTTLGLLFFILLCSLPISLLFLQLYLFGLTGSLIWMVITILKNGEPPRHTFDDRFYEDATWGRTECGLGGWPVANFEKYGPFSTFPV